MDNLLHPDAARSMSAEPGHVLLVDDEVAFQRVGSTVLRGFGYRVTTAGDAETAVARFRDARPDVVLLDLSMPPRMTPEAGLELLAAFRAVPVVVLTGHADHTLALRAAELGAWDFLAKPIEPEMLRFVVGRAARQARLARELAKLQAQQASDEMGLVGRSEAIRRLREMVRRLGPTAISVLVLGPTGTGKELVARALHQTSARRGGPFVALHCGALPGELLESELFGHLKGSFTGAHLDRTGLLDAAHRGTLFLDEIGEMPLAMQVKLLRFLQEGTFTPVGGREVRRADVRVVAATHRDLETMVAQGGFREDLFYRLKGFVLRTPALAERRGDVALLATVFLRRTAGPRASFADDALIWLTAQEWPGNVRELRALVETAAALSSGGATMPEVDAELLRFARGEADALAAPKDHAGAQPHGALDLAVAALEARMIREALECSGGNRSEAARRLGVSRVGLLKKMARLEIR